MSMTKGNFIALADAIREHNHAVGIQSDMAFGEDHLNLLAAFCKQQNSAFMRERWLGYIAGTNGKNGGKVGA